MFIKSLGLKYTKSIDGLKYFIEKVREILLICIRAILEFQNVYFI